MYFFIVIIIRAERWRIVNVQKQNNFPDLCALTQKISSLIKFLVQIQVKEK